MVSAMTSHMSSHVIGPLFLSWAQGSIALDSRNPFANNLALTNIGAMLSKAVPKPFFASNPNSREDMSMLIRSFFFDLYGGIARHIVFRGVLRPRVEVESINEALN